MSRGPRSPPDRRMMHALPRRGKPSPRDASPPTVVVMDISDVTWNEQARAKILDDADAVLRDAVRSVAASGEISSDDAFAQLNTLLKDRFIDYEPGPDIRKYADAIAAGEFAASGED